MINISENVFRIGCTFQGVALIYFLNVSEARGASTSTYNRDLKKIPIGAMSGAFH